MYFNTDGLSHSLQLFESDVESHGHSVAQVNSHATDVIASCNPKMAASIEAKLQELNSGSQSVIAKCRER